MKTLFIPFSEISLVEFLSSGFIGVSTSAVSYSDIHTRLWPSTLVVKSVEDTPLPICCEVEVEGRAYSYPSIIGSKRAKTFKIKKPLSIHDIKAIYFDSESSLNEFFSKYNYMTDLNLDEFSLVVSGALSHANLSVLGNEDDQYFLSEKESPGLDNSTSKHDLLNHAKSLAAFTYGFHKELKINSPKKVPVLSEIGDVEKALDEISSLLEVRFPPRGLSLLLEQYWQLCRDDSIDVRSDQMEIVESLSRGLEASKDGGHEHTKVTSFLDRISNVFMGMEAHPNLDEKDPEKAFQYGFYVSLMAKDTNDFVSLKNRFRFSDEVESIAKYLFVVRSRFNQLEKAFFNSFNSRKRDWASAILKSFWDARTELEISAKEGSEDLDIFCDLIISDRKVGDVTKKLSPEEQVVVSTLRTFGTEPFRDFDTGDIAVKKYVQSNPIIVTLKILKSSSSPELSEVYIQYKSSVKHGVLSKAKPRLELLRLVTDQGVALGVNDEGTLILTRLQMVDTMDRDELWHHVEQIAEGGALMEKALTEI